MRTRKEISFEMPNEFLSCPYITISQDIRIINQKYVHYTTKLKTYYPKITILSKYQFKFTYLDKYIYLQYNQLTSGMEIILQTYYVICLYI